MRVEFRKQAEEDLNAIVAWYESTAPAAVTAILEDIYHSIDQLIAFPRSGPRVPGHRFRRMVTRKYHFKIAYVSDEETVTILGIYRFQDRKR